MPPEGVIRAVLFDLDGTFADTAPDLAHALNETLRAFGRDPLPYETIRPWASYGGVGLMRIGFGLGPGERGFDERRAHLLEIYRANLCRQTRLFEGMAECIDTLEGSGVPWGIVTNKPAWLTDPLMTALGYAERAGTVVSGDTCAERKPHPEPVLCACRDVAVAPAATLFVGDAERDIAAGRAAGALTAAARYGYIPAGEDPFAWGADFLVDACAEVVELLRASRPQPAAAGLGPDG